MNIETLVFFVAIGLIGGGFKELKGKPSENTGKVQRNTLLGSTMIIFGFSGFPIILMNFLLKILYLITCGSALFLIKRKDGETIVSKPTPDFSARTIHSVDQMVAKLLSIDPNFSKVLFLDFASQLYHKYYTFLGTREYPNLLPFLSEEVKALALKEHTRRKNLNISTIEIVIGSIRISSVNITDELVTIAVELEANYTNQFIHMDQINQNRLITGERWLFSRNKTVISAEPEKMRELSCPNCGAPANFSGAGACQYCHTMIIPGEMQWVVQKQIIVSKETFQAKPVTYVEETGTNLPTVTQANFNDIKQNFLVTNQLTNWNEFWDSFKQTIVSPYFQMIYDTWSRNRWEDARHLVSDRLYESYAFWIANYKRAGFINRLENIQLQKIELARIDEDKYYESLTVRIYASCLDYVENKQGKVVGGSKTKLRRFSEYWVFIQRKARPILPPVDFNPNSCPNCGAPADQMGQAAVCGYCGSKISYGDFSWVLSMIIQDEVYKG